MLYSSANRESEEYARFSEGCCFISSGTISDVLMLMNKGAISALEIMLFKIRRGCFKKSATLLQSM